MKIVLVSDNHGDISSIKKILNREQDGEYYLHCGDCEMSREELRPFSPVKGNNDYAYDYPLYKVLEIGDHRIFITHGHRYIILNSLNGLVAKAHELCCDVVFFGHTHIFNDTLVDGVHLINPGSCFINRDRSKPSYAIVEFIGPHVIVKRKDVD